MMENSSRLMGHLGKDPELAYTPDNVAVATLSIATNSYYKDKNGESKSRTDWHRVVFFNNHAANIAESLKKGAYVAIEGYLRTRSYDDKQGLKRYVTEVIGREIKFLDKVDSNTAQAKTEGTPYENQKHDDSVAQPEVPEDIPF